MASLGRTQRYGVYDVHELFRSHSDSVKCLWHLPKSEERSTGNPYATFGEG